jgi:hypothetical protein
MGSKSLRKKNNSNNAVRLYAAGNWRYALGSSCPFSVANTLRQDEKDGREQIGKERTITRRRKKNGSLNEQKTLSKGEKEIKTEVKGNNEGTRAMSAKPK